MLHDIVLCHVMSCHVMSCHVPPPLGGPGTRAGAAATRSPRAPAPAGLRPVTFQQFQQFQNCFQQFLTFQKNICSAIFEMFKKEKTAPAGLRPGAASAEAFERERERERQT